MFYTVYKTTHLESGKIYIGMHTTAKADDSYLGSGTLISRAIKKYGRDSFVKEVLFVFDNSEAMIAKEKELVTEEFVARDDTFNLNVGGDGGWWAANGSRTPEQSRNLSMAGNAARRRAAVDDPTYFSALAAQGVEALRRVRASPAFNPNTFQGRKHSEEAKAKMKGLGLRVGTKNPQYGKIWISRPEDGLKMVPREDLPRYLEAGWLPGKKNISCARSSVG